MSNLRKDLMFQVFLHVNRDLSELQRRVLKLVIGPDGGYKDSISQAILLISQRLKVLEDAGWQPENKKGDQVLTPSHYDRWPMEPTYFIVESGGFHWCIENFIKYVVRFPFKNGTEDLRKAMRNLAMYVRYLEGQETWSR